MKAQLSKEVTKSATPRRKPPAAGKGRPKGALNKTTGQLKDMILQALDGAGGVQYLQDRANDPRTASAFLSLVGKVLPMQVTGADGADLAMKLTVEYVRAGKSTTT